MEPKVDDGADPLGVAADGSVGPLSSTVYPLRSTFDSDGVSLREWGLLREGVRVFAVFYMTRWDYGMVQPVVGRVSTPTRAYFSTTQHEDQTDLHPTHTRNPMLTACRTPIFTVILYFVQ